jgi:hypothetical protein
MLGIRYSYSVSPGRAQGLVCANGKVGDPGFLIAIELHELRVADNAEQILGRA